MNTHITLFDLLRLNEGQLSTAEAEILQESIGKNPELETKWALLQETYLQLIGPVTAKHWSRSNIHSLTIASYLDQQLSPTEEAEFEQTCWQENRVLFEVLDCYQSSLQPLSQEGLRGGAKERMLGLLENSLSSKQTSTTGEKPPGRTNGTPARQNGFPRKAPPGENGKRLKIKVNTSDDSKNRLAGQPWSSTTQVLCWTSTALVALLAFSFWWTRTGNDPGESRTVEEQNRQPSANDSPGFQQDDPSPGEKTIDSPNRPSLFDDNSLAKDGDDPAKPPAPAPPSLVDDQRNRQDPSNHPLEVPEKNRPDNSLTGGNRQPDPIANSNNPSSYPRSASFRWQKIKGVVASKDPYESNWSATGSKTSFADQSLFKTFPGSWAEAKTAGQSIVVVDEDTALSLRANEDGSQFEINLQHGKTGFKKITKGTRFQVNIGKSNLNMVSLDDDSEFGLDFKETGPRVFVRKGKMKINQTTVPKGFNVIAESTETPDLTVFATMKSFDDVRWLTKSQSKTNIPVPLRSSLVKSTDIEKDLRGLLNSKNRASKETAVQWCLTMDDGATLVRFVNSGDPVIQLAAFNWLIHQDVFNPRTLHLWRMIQDLAVRNPQSQRKLPSLFRWNRLPFKQNIAWPDRDVSTMKSMLSHQVWLFRKLSSYFLEKKFGNRSGYHPDLAPANRNSAANNWIRSINAQQAQFSKRPGK